MEISKPIMDYAKKCIRAMFYSAQAFWGIEGGRLVVTNVWGTAHAYVLFSYAPFLLSLFTVPPFAALQVYAPNTHRMAA